MLEFDDPAVKSLLVELDEKGSAKGDYDPDVLLDSLVRSVQRQEADRQRPVHTGALREGGMDESQELELLQRLVQEARNRHGISKPTEG
jgi:hypothetical protein